MSDRAEGEARATDRRGRDARWALVAATLALAFAGFLLASVGGRRLLLSGRLWPNDILFGMDAARGVDSIGKLGYHNRDNVHPYFYRMVQPLGRLVQALHITPGMSAILVNAAFGALGLCLAALYFRRRGAGRPEAWLATFLMGGTATWLIQSAVPETFIFSFCAIAWLHLLAVRSLARGDAGPPADRRANGPLGETGWLAAGLVAYGITVTNGMMAFLTYGFARGRGNGWRRAWGRATVYGAAVLALGVAISLAIGSSLNLLLEWRWVADPAFHGRPLPHPFLQSLSTALVWTATPPDPSIVPTLDDRGHYLIAAFNQWHYSPTGWLLVAGWMALLTAGVWAAARDRDRASRAASLALASCLAFHVVLHAFYHIAYEGMFLYAGHSLFLVVGLLAPLLRNMSGWPVGRRRLARGALAALGLMLWLRNGALLMSLPTIVPLPK